MARIILKSSFMNKQSHKSNLINYIGTRDGVELNSYNDEAVSDKQIDLINNLIDEFEFLKLSETYKKFEVNQTRINASIFLTDSFETLESKLMNKEIYLKYIAERPNVEKFEEHGLFNENGFADLNKEIKDIKNHTGIVWANIISLKREDAELTGYDNAQAYQKLIKFKAKEISEMMNIKYNNFVWNGAFHNEGNHPHIHLLCYSKNSNEGYLNKENIENIKKILTREIFKNQFLEIEKDKDKYRTIIREDFRKLVKEEFSNLDTKNKFLIATNLKSDKRNYYKYQDKKVKKILREEVKRIINENDSLVENFEAFKECEKKIKSFYTEKDLSNIDNEILENHEEFKSVFLNSILKEITDNRYNLLKDYNNSNFEDKLKENLIKIESNISNNFIYKDEEKLLDISNNLNNKNNSYKYQDRETRKKIDLFIESKIESKNISDFDMDNLRKILIKESTKLRLDNIKDDENFLEKKYEFKLEFKFDKFDSEKERLDIDKLFNEKKDYFNFILSDLVKEIDLKEKNIKTCCDETKNKIITLSELILTENNIDLKSKYSKEYLENKILKEANSLKIQKVLEYKSKIEDYFNNSLLNSKINIKEILNNDLRLSNEMSFRSKSLDNLKSIYNNQEIKEYKNTEFNLNQKIKREILKEKIDTLEIEINNLKNEKYNLKLNEKDKEILDLLKNKNINEVSRIILNKEINNDINTIFKKYNELFNNRYKNIFEDKILIDSITKKIDKTLENIKIETRNYQLNIHSKKFETLINSMFDFELKKFNDVKLQTDIDKINNKIIDFNLKSYYSQSSEVKEEINLMIEKIINNQYVATGNISKEIKNLYKEYLDKSNMNTSINEDKIFKDSLSNKLFNKIILIKEENINNQLDNITTLYNTILNKLISKNFKISDELSSDLFELSKKLKSNRYNFYDSQSEEIKKDVDEILNKILNNHYDVISDLTSKESSAKQINKLYKNYMNGDSNKLETDRVFKNLLTNKILSNATNIKKEFYTFEKLQAKYEYMDKVNKDNIRNSTKNLCMNIADGLFKMTKEEQQGQGLIKSINKRLEFQAKRKKKHTQSVGMDF